MWYNKSNYNFRWAFYMDEKFQRTEMLIGKDGIKKLKKAKVAVFGVGGVGSFVCEGLARSGVGSFVLIDHDKVSESNINRQLIATTKTIGKYKVDVMKKRILEINPDANVEVYCRKCRHRHSPYLRHHH